MFLRWFWLDHVPSGTNLTREDRHTVAMHAGVMRRNEPHFRKAARRYLLKYHLPLMLAYVAVLAVAYWSRDPFLIIVTVTPIFVLLAWYGQYRTGAPFVRRSMAKVGYETCLSCGYLLQGLGDEHERCPECGEARDPENRDEARARAEMRGLLPRPRI